MAIVPRKTRYGTGYTAVYRTTDGTQKSAGTFSTPEKRPRPLTTTRCARCSAESIRARRSRRSSPARSAATSRSSAFADQWLPKHDVTHNGLTYLHCLKGYSAPKFGELAECLGSIDKLLPQVGRTAHTTWWQSKDLNARSCRIPDMPTSRTRGWTTPG